VRPCSLNILITDLDHTSPNNWLDDTLWLKLAYHTWRAPLLVNSNWWLSFKADPSDPPAPTYGSSKEGVPESNPSEDLPAGSQGGGQEWLDTNATGQGSGSEMVSYDEATKREWITGYQMKKAAWVLRRFAEYRLMLQK
jgi:carnitine O-acetyltransferase